MAPIVLAEPVDFEGVRALAAREGSAFDPAAEVERHFARLWVARGEATHEVLGFLLAWDVADEVHLLDLVVAPQARRRGLGKRLLGALLEHAATSRARRVLLEVRRGNTPALALYEAAGFEHVGERSGYYADGEDALLMTRERPAC
ncbi:MAG TPA: GNAT family N-acetyltransferase [Polyangiaceae bacterium]|nr:GNAT family N-acetyltransferase [Polyangiaceae bacterium]